LIGLGRADALSLKRVPRPLVNRVLESKWRWIVVPLAVAVITTAANWLWFGEANSGDAGFGLFTGLVLVGVVEVKQRSVDRR
jgi:hypothetical protein